MEKVAKLQAQIKDKSREIVNLKNNLATQESLTKTYSNEIDNLTIKLNASEASLVRNTEVVDLFIEQEREKSSVSRRPTIDSDEENNGLEQRTLDEQFPDNGDHIGATSTNACGGKIEACPLFFRFGKEGCPGAEMCGRNHAPEILKKKGICFKDFQSKGSCPRGDGCWFTHETPEELRADPGFRKFIEEEMDKAEKWNKKERPRSSRKSSISSSTRRDIQHEDAVEQAEYPERNENYVSSDVDEKSNTTHAYDQPAGQSQNFLDQGQIIQFIQQQVQYSLSYFMSQICPQMGWQTTPI